MNKLILLAAFVAVMLLMSFASDKKKKIIFFGDSITQMGISPNGYITKMKEMLQTQSISNYDLVGAGIGGNKVYDLYLRMDEDVISQSPDIVVIYVGVNDVWHKSSFGTGTDADKFEKFYRALIKKLQDNNIKVMLCTPAVIGEKKDFTNQQDGDLNKYSSIIKSIGKDLQLPVCDLRTLFINYYATHNPDDLDKGILTTDGVHLNDAGNQMVAEQMWNILKDIK